MESRCVVYQYRIRLACAPARESGPPVQTTGRRPEQVWEWRGAWWGAVVVSTVRREEGVRAGRGDKRLALHLCTCSPSVVLSVLSPVNQNMVVGSS